MFVELQNCSHYRVRRFPHIWGPKESHAAVPILVWVSFPCAAGGLATKSKFADHWECSRHLRAPYLHVLRDSVVHGPVQVVWGWPASYPYCNWDEKGTC